MPAVSAVPRSRTIEMILCSVVLLIMLVAVLYTAWISLSNYSQIGV